MYLYNGMTFEINTNNYLMIIWLFTHFFFLFKLAVYMKTIHNLCIFFIKKKGSSSKAIAQSSFQNAKNVLVKPLESLTSFQALHQVCFN